MLTLNDGRIELYQWDTGRKLSVAVECTQVHYSNKVFGRSIDVDVVDGVAIIPDILLQTDKELTAWAFVGTPENGYTKISKTFKVNRRNKPADYVFTPPEQTTLGELVERLQKIEETQDPDAIKNAVEDYLEKNPVEAPVKSVNGKTGKIELSAEDVGAISQDDLQNATNKALEQAKDSGEFNGKPGMPGKPGDDGITPHIGDNGNWFIGDTDTGKPSRGEPGDDYELTDEDRQEIAGIAAGMVPGGGGDTKSWRKIAEHTVAEDSDNMTWFEITQDKDGNPLDLKKIMLICTPLFANSTDSIYILANSQAGRQANYIESGTNAYNNKEIISIVERVHERVIVSNTTVQSLNVTDIAKVRIRNSEYPIDGIRLGLSTVRAGTKYEVWGIDK